MHNLNNIYHFINEFKASELNKLNPKKISIIYRNYSKKTNTKESSNLNKDIKYKIKAKIEKKKKELKELKKLYSEPKKAQIVIKKQISKKVVKKREEIKNAYSSPSEIFASPKVQKWAAVQVVKAFLGIPIVPGK